MAVGSSPAGSTNFIEVMKKIEKIHKAIDDTSKSSNLDKIHKSINDSEQENIRLQKMVDQLLVHCQIDECTVCAEIVCPHKDPLHLHHDGCPSCHS